MRESEPSSAMSADPNPAAGLPTRFLRFLAVGGFATILMYVLLVAGIEGLGLRPLLASVLAYLLSAVVNYALNRRLTFRSRQRHRVALPRFAIVSGTGLLLNTAIMALGTELAAWHYLPVQVVATLVVLFWNFVGSQWWTFRTSSGRQA
jgi:putative flippase GtrA